MNILVIGNGFDLAHGLPTSYREFLEFCKRVKYIYESDNKTSIGTFEEQYLNEWEIDDFIKEQLRKAFQFTHNISIRMDGECYEEEDGLRNVFDELYGYIERNTWLDYFLECSSYIGENWIDFEKEIANVVTAFEASKIHLQSGIEIFQLEKEYQKILMSLIKKARYSLQDAIGSKNNLLKFVDFLYDDLEKLVRALEIYIAEFVGKMEVKKLSEDIKKIDVDYVLSFNYSNTYERLYSNDEVECDFIHGKADINNRIVTNNMVLGIDEYLPEDRKDIEIDFIAFKKYFQRIQKGTGSVYKTWVERIIKDEKAKKVWLVDGKDHSRDNRHNLYIFGHSLDITDKDILRDFILHDNVDTTVFYYERFDREGKGDNGRKELGQKIANLVKVIGQDELIKRTGGKTKTIEFKLQSEMKKIK